MMIGIEKVEKSFLISYLSFMMKLISLRLKDALRLVVASWLLVLVA
jgi:hypothetical protein